MHTPPDCPNYRVRLFLSADLSNSTAYKSSRPPHKWVSVFRDFYDEFVELFRRKHLEIVSEHRGAFDEFKSRPPLLGSGSIDRRCAA